MDLASSATSSRVGTVNGFMSEMIVRKFRVNL
jgi:hypothetical protein